MTVLLHMTPAVNLTAITADGLQAAIGPRSMEIGEETAGVYLFRTLEAAETGLLNWFGEWFEDEPGALALLAVDLDLDVAEDPTVFEVFFAGDIPADRITILADDVNDVTHFGDLQRQIEKIGDCLRPTYDTHGSPSP